MSPGIDHRTASRFSEMSLSAYHFSSTEAYLSRSVFSHPCAQFTTPPLRSSPLSLQGSKRAGNSHWEHRCPQSALPSSLDHLIEVFSLTVRYRPLPGPRNK